MIVPKIVRLESIETAKDTYKVYVDPYSDTDEFCCVSFGSRTVLFNFTDAASITLEEMLFLLEVVRKKADELSFIRRCK